ncbi:Transcription factor bHLH94 [Morella rubra]|uniref:Transcription factor bHLH94 n=1 Tax=Morella rubra TaxID=262757 RepID=A0A6A1VNM7_9ROSI|nr:Transcription factor bHLH94 [Morella rubra]
MNDYLAVLRSMMPASYVQRGDQASIIGGALNFVKELEQLLQSLQAQKRIKQRPDISLSSSFSGFFTFPQYSNCSTESRESMGEKRPAIADIEVTMIERHANVKVLSRQYPKQLLKMVAGLHSLHLIVLHLNVTTVENMVLYSFSVKVGEDSQLTSTNEIAAAVNEMVGRIQVEAPQFT